MKKLCLIFFSIFFINLISAFPICIDATMPTAPSTLEVTSSGTNIILNWGAATDEPNCSGIDYYNIFRDNVFIGNVSSDTLTFTDLNVPYGTYSYGVYAIDKVGHNSGPIRKNDVVLSPGSKGTNVGGGGGSTSYVVIPLKIGNNQNLQKGMTYGFIIDKEEHTLKIDSIGKDYIWVIISSEPKRIKLNFGDKATKIDVDGDGINDISLELISIDNNGHISIEYHKLDNEGNETSEENKEVVELTPEEPEAQGGLAGITGAVIGGLRSTTGIITIVFILGIVGMAITVRQIRKRRK